MEYFLGLCDYDTVNRWRLCSTELEELRPRDCILDYALEESNARVHRRFCDMSILAFYAEQCNCLDLGHRKLYSVIGRYILLLPPDFGVRNRMCFKLLFHFALIKKCS